MKLNILKFSLLALLMAFFSVNISAQDTAESDIAIFDGTYNGKLGVYYKIRPSSGEGKQEWPEVNQNVTLSVGIIAKKGGKNKVQTINYTEVCKAVVYKSDEKKNIFEVRVLEDFKSAAAKKNLKIDLKSDTPLRVSWKNAY